MEAFVVTPLTKPAIVGGSKDTRLAVEACRKAARETSPILFQGEVGSGKYLMATYLHRESPRSGKSFLLVDCSQPEEIKSFLNLRKLEDKFQLFRGGAVYFREVASLGLEDQSRLHQACLTAEALDMRVCLSSSQNVHVLMYEKAFNGELYRYASQCEIYISALRQRREDIMELTRYYIQKLNLRLRKSIQGITPQAEEVFMTYRWPGNVEELQNVLTRAMVLAHEPFIGQRHLAESIGQMGDNLMQTPDVMPLDRMEEILLRTALNRYGTSLEGKKRAARALNISLATLYNKVKRYNLNE
ncbi:MAG: sigma 54-interacting transcriptional regulator [Desulfitobacteriaceae bacterium]|nr:sigma 54-interacting transcriptional regulator [Desulfitobacteriaceae bacterium]MDI6877791.1 sigma 54-interacting transcriptional regulator [Desulfitobacteriaceae bacterium]MDI6912870.1 sigma 54-interacting transcriptional regulator [Desulfitobacteriaceae bacterium]